MMHANRMKHIRYEHRGDITCYYQSNVKMMLLLAHISDHNELLKKNIKDTCSTKLRAIVIEHVPSEDNVKSDNVNEDKGKTNREEAQ